MVKKWCLLRCRNFKRAFVNDDRGGPRYGKMGLIYKIQREDR